MREMFKNANNFNLKFKAIFVFNFEDGIGSDFIHEIKTENDLFKDMLIPDVEDNYHTVGLKLMASFNWLKNLRNSNLKWIIKLDDDVIINFGMLQKYITKRRFRKKAIHCSYASMAETKRNVNSKW